MGVEAGARAGANDRSARTKTGGSLGGQMERLGLGRPAERTLTRPRSTSPATLGMRPLG